ncbi:hypothetical protein LU276_08355 [Moraxella haemolytica]|uniref:hypothetical protein n=1 Tax=Moraxella haemolytica TaxID=2904119 RepID=UPI002543EE74|nr:hypothetical protein [Moraxella sp. ZY171148]WII95012.1 hypothetical protein LU276_08355 [Moraxella sp. ZY171148]
MNIDEVSAVAEGLTGVSLDVCQANRLLVSSLVKYLANKNVIDLDDYLDYSQQVKELLINNTDSESGLNSTIIDFVFELHQNDFRKPE